MRAVSARHPSSPVPQEPLSSYSGSDRNYRTGTADPPHFADAGAGGWNSHAKTAAVRAEKVALTALIAQGATNLYPGPNATKHLEHYLQNTGLDYTVDLENMVRVVPSARTAMIAEFRLARAFLKTLPTGRHKFTSILLARGTTRSQKIPTGSSLRGVIRVGAKAKRSFPTESSVGIMRWISSIASTIVTTGTAESRSRSRGFR